ncbi:MAG TPA: hypothetical protein VLC09_20810 [Polyangiaceae bacterium]|nr:hypothetical protein [Polyangiaceae bacterium]
MPEPALPTTAASQLLPPNPLAISRLAIDARARAATWQKEAELAEVRLTIADGKPRDLVFSFALPRGHFSPGIPLTGKHFELAFDAERREFAEREVSTGPALGAADPNCPLDAAYRAATQAGLSAQTLRTSYAYSAKHRRELWTFQGAGKPLLVDGANCAILVR